MNEMNKSDWKLWMRILHNLAQIEDELIRVFSFGRIQANSSQILSSIFTKMMQERDLQKKFK